MYIAQTGTLQEKWFKLSITGTEFSKLNCFCSSNSSVNANQDLNPFIVQFNDEVSVKLNIACISLHPLDLGLHIPRRYTRRLLIFPKTRVHFSLEPFRLKYHE